MRKATLLFLVVGAVLVFAVASASAQATPPPYGPAITLEQAKKAMAGARNLGARTRRCRRGRERTR